MTKIKYNKLWEAIRSQEKLPRKIKKHILGKLMSKCKLNRLLDSVTIGRGASTMFETADIQPYTFCPNCGCTKLRGGGNMSVHPEHWERFYCLRCNAVVGYIDNSPFIHALECKENDYDPEF